MAKSIKSSYQPIDIHKGSGWPEVVPPMTEKDAINAFRRLYRWGVGNVYESKIEITSGNRRATRFDWDARGVMVFHLNPSKGWREFIHDLSHDLDYIVNGEGGHSKFHARLERNMIAQVIKRGWLEPKPEAPLKVVPINNTESKRKLALERIEARIVSWDRKLRRAENALKKLAKQKRYYEKALGK